MNPRHTCVLHELHRSLRQFVWLYANVAVAQTPSSLKAGICSNMRLTSGPLTPMKGEIVQIEDVKGNWKFITRKPWGQDCKFLYQWNYSLLGAEGLSIYINFIRF